MSSKVDEGSTIDRRRLKVVGLFAGIGGLELGLQRAGHEAELLCEIDPRASAVLQQHWPEVPVAPDIKELRSLPACDLVVAGFPCQDISLAGTQRGISGPRSGLIAHVFRLVRTRRPEFLLFENVLYLIKRDRGAQLKLVTDELESLGYRWAYRVVDSRGFGLPQRRQRVVILASRGERDPAEVLFATQVDPLIDDSIGSIRDGSNYGFYWTEGKRAVGWAQDAVPTIKGGSGLGIPSPPAVFDSSVMRAGTPSVRDGERLQGFDPGWTDVVISDEPLREGHRWTLVGNAVSVPVAQWIGEALALPDPQHWAQPGNDLEPGRPMPWAAARSRSGVRRYAVSPHVVEQRHEPIGLFIRDPLKPLSPRAIRGFLNRAESGVMNLPEAFLAGLRDQQAEELMHAKV